MKLIIASGPVIVENNAVLLSKHGDDLFWKFPGGSLENFEENLREGAARKVKEEVGIDIAFEEREPFLMHVTKTKDGTTIDVILVHFIARRTGEIVKGNIREYAWIPLDNLPEDIAPNIKPALQFFKFI